MAELPDHVHGLLEGPITSVSQLDVLLLLYRSGRELSTEEIFLSVKTSREAVVAHVRALQVAGLVDVREGEPAPLCRYVDTDSWGPAVGAIAGLDPGWRGHIVASIHRS